MDYYRGKVFRFIDRFIKNQDLAEDLTQDVMIKIWSHRHRISQLSDPDNYILKIAKHHVLDHFKKLAREKSYQEEVWQFIQINHRSPESPIVVGEINRQLDAVVKRLPSRQQEIYTLSKRKGLSLEEISASLNIEQRTVRNHLNRAMKTIRSQIDTDTFLTVLVVIILLEKFI